MIGPALDEREQRRVDDTGGGGHGPLVAEDQVVAGAAVHRVTARTRDHQVVVLAGGQVVVAAVGEINADGGDLRNREPLRGPRTRVVVVRRDQPSAVAEHDVLAVTGVDRVTVAPADDNVVVAIGRDVVDAAGRRGRQALDQVDVRGLRVCPGHGTITLLTHVVDLAVVAEHDVVARAGTDEFDGSAVDAIVVPAEHDVVARARRDVVTAAVAELDGLDQTEGHRHAGQLRCVHRPPP